LQTARKACRRSTAGTPRCSRLAVRRSVPGPVKRNESAVFVGGREFAALVDQHVVGRPMSGKCRYRCLLLGADAHSLSTIAAVFRGENQLLLDIVVIAFRPTKIGALLQLD